MDVKQLISELNNFDTDAVVVVGDICGWSNIESVAEDGSCVKILMSDNVVFSDDRAAKNAEPPAIPQQPQGKICCAGCKNLMDSGERDCGMDFPPCYKRKLSPVR